MIVRMKKVTFLVSDKERDGFLMKLRQIGVVHIKPLSFPSSEEIKSLQERLTVINKAIEVLYLDSKTDSIASKSYTGDLIKYAESILKASKEREAIIRNIQDTIEKMEWFRPWGQFNPKDLKVLKEKGIVIKLYRLPKKEYKNIGDNLYKKIIVLTQKDGYFYIAFLSYKRDEKLDFEEVVPPDKDLGELQKERDCLRRRLAEIDSFLKEAHSAKGIFKKEISALRRKLAFLNVRHSMKEEEDFSYLQGFCPRESLGQLVSLARSCGVGFFVEEPDDPDETPTLIKNPRWIRIVEPVFKFMSTLPGYNEYDISLPFLIFFSLFFAMLIGDAGYGILFLMITYLARRRLRHLPQEPFLLMYLLGSATVIWGVLNGTWFGIMAMVRYPALADPNFIMHLCFIIGAVHLSIAHFIIALRVINSIRVFAQLGWLLIIWGLFCVAGTLVLDKPLLPFTSYLILTGASFVLLFSNPSKNIWKGILVTLSDLPLKIIGSFSDIVSYIRLFAVGYATVVVAKSFNEMALSFGFNSIIGSFSAAAILFLGHTLNIILGLMAVVVHGIRLNMLEFSSHLGMQWSGKEYKPFKED